jgi:metal-dependent hydrolase (beta-lactamase superfamily II)
MYLDDDDDDYYENDGKSNGLCNDDDGVSEEKWKGMDGKMNNEMVCGQNEKKGVIMITSCTHNIIYLYI